MYGPMDVWTTITEDTVASYPPRPVIFSSHDQSWWICLSTTLSFFPSLCPWGGCVNLILSAWYLNSALPPFLLLLLLFLLFFSPDSPQDHSPLFSFFFLSTLCVLCVCLHNGCVCSPQKPC